MPKENTLQAPKSDPKVLKKPIQLLKEAWAVYTQNIGLFLAIMAPAALLSALNILGTFPFLGLAALFVQLWANLAIIYAVRDIKKGVDFNKAYGLAWKRLAAFVWISALTFLITAGGFLLLIIPGIIFAVWFALSAYVLVAEDTRGLNALLKSKLYVQGDWWKVFGRILFMGVVFFAFFFLPAVVLSGVFGNPSVENDPVTGIFGLLASAAFTPFAIAYLFAMYSNLKKLKKGATFEPEKDRKKFIAVAVLGIVAIVVFFVALAFLLASLLGGGQFKDLPNGQFEPQELNEQL